MWAFVITRTRTGNVIPAETGYGLRIVARQTPRCLGYVQMLVAVACVQAQHALGQKLAV